MIKPMTRREAVKLRKRVRELEGILDKQRYTWTKEWPSYQVLCRIPGTIHSLACVETARTLKHAVVVVVQGEELVFFADKLPNQQDGPRG